MKKQLNLAIIVMLMVLLQACGGSSDDPTSKAKSLAKIDTSSPNGAFMSMIQSFKSNDIKALMQASMSDEDYQKAITEFDTQKSKPSEADKVQFAQTMEMLTNDGAVDKLMAMVSPQLEQARTQMPMLLMMGKGMVGPSIESSPDIPSDQKESLTKIANAFIDYASETDLLSEEITRKAITTAVDTAKSLNMNSLDELQGMSFDQAMDKASIAMGGVKNIMSVYGISIDDMLNSIEVSDVVEEGDTAKMNISYDLIGETFNQDVKMKKVNGQWVADQ
jgi:major membrane immunogen (membrane-anchored lipoprotein)